jgi:hypothetical protein
VRAPTNGDTGFKKILFFILSTLFFHYYNLTSITRIFAMSNYTPKMVAAITAAAPLNLAKAKALAEEFGSVTYRSVISKAQSIGVEYVKAAPAARKPRDSEPTKADILRGVRLALALPEREGDLTKAELSAVLVSIA